MNLKKSNDLEISLIATNETFYIDKDMYEAHDALICIKNKTYIQEKKRIKLSNNHYLKDDKEMYELFSDIPEALENNYNFPYRCSYKPSFSKPILPNISSEKDGNADDILKKNSLTGLKDKFIKVFKKDINNLTSDQDYQKYLDRLNHELDIINSMNYSSYFLIVSDYIKWAKNKYPAHKVGKSNPILQKLRSIKSKEEINQIKKACDITKKGVERIISFIKPGVWEYEIEAELIHEFIKNKSRGFAYSPIIASGKNANILHYELNNHKCKSGELILLDVAAEYGNYCSDLTRTLPVSGIYNDRQKKVYNSCLLYTSPSPRDS